MHGPLVLETIQGVRRVSDQAIYPAWGVLVLATIYWLEA